MRRTLRRSCEACAKSKLSCDLRTPQCSRCIKRKITNCVYANEPLTLSPTEQSAIATLNHGPSTFKESAQSAVSPPTLLGGSLSQAFDPFDVYPRTRLPRARVQQLINHFLSSIAFQYYPLDLGKSSNPFVVSWWPLALQDPALFHVSLQTASLDLDLKAKNGFQNSEILMQDSISLVRQRVEDQFLSCSDETMDSVVTLAAIEFGKGNFSVGSMHIEGVIKMVLMRGGIHTLKLTSPLTARMVSWVSMILLQTPQFDVQNDWGRGDAIAPIPQWVDAADKSQKELPSHFVGLEIQLSVRDTLLRLRSIFDMSQQQALSTTDLHDLTCFVLHKLLSLSPPPFETSRGVAESECVRYSVALYMLIIHGPTYFTHAHLQSNLVSGLRAHLDGTMQSLSLYHEAIALWGLTVGMVASDGTSENFLFESQVKALCVRLNLHAWVDIRNLLEQVLWYKMPWAELIFQQRWEMAMMTTWSHCH
ncbi:c6 zinc finger domain-containing protein [Stemphylium lycopersici]|uniref:C6 zinc finger domain-containing protein n=1 Tax=Stemphylium lycopersici TaxID=183478 RepID=A0A364MW98_STELY|nr:c6 zinc finger domain-containing protein [Stemphylium lycopersici]RAR05056.1 c6 zinc finger domain-containing protein [Stemphylium lycopersici]